MAMLRVSSYRKLFEEQRWRQNRGSSMLYAGQYRTPGRSAVVDKCSCDKLDFVSAKALSKEGLIQFTQDNAALAALNNRLVRLIELARCFEEENESLESQIIDLEGRLPSPGRSRTKMAVSDSSLDAVIVRLRIDRDNILCDTEELKKELECLKKEYEQALQQRTIIQLKRLHLAKEADAGMAECLALSEQAGIYEEQLATMEARRHATVEGLLEAPEGTSGSLASIEFCSPDITPGLRIKEYYGRLAESLQCECGKFSSAAVPPGDGEPAGWSTALSSKGKVPPNMADIDRVKELVGELWRELAELQKCNAELEGDVEANTAAHQEEIAELECTIEEMRNQQLDFEDQMKDQCKDYRELLHEKMTRDLEIAAYRGLVEEEEERLCNL